jgi:hypothetical protein
MRVYRTCSVFFLIVGDPQQLRPNIVQRLSVRTFLKVYIEIGSYFLFLQEQIKDIIIICVFITAVP